MLDYQLVRFIQSEHSLFASAGVLIQNHKMADANDNNFYAPAILFADKNLGIKLKKTGESFKSGRFRLPRGKTGDGCQKREPPAQTGKLNTSASTPREVGSDAEGPLIYSFNVSPGVFRYSEHRGFSHGLPDSMVGIRLD